MTDAIKQWFDALTDREQRIVAIGLPIGIILGFYMVVWEPAIEKNGVLTQRAQAERTLNVWLNQQAHQYASKSKQTENLSLASVVETSLREKGLSAYTARIHKDSQENTVIQFNAIPYEDFINWLLDVQQQYAVILHAATIQRLERKGVVDVSITFADKIETR